MRYFLIPLMALSLFNAPLFAKHNHKGKCTCDHKCAEKCTAGKGENCKCKACDCAKNGHCEGKCEHHDEEPSKTEKESNKE